MPIGEFTQANIIDGDSDADAEVTIDTNGRQIRPVTTLLSRHSDEVKLHVTEDGLWSRFVDPANVAMGYVKAHPEAFDSYELDGDDFLAGVFVSSLHDAVRSARKPQNDDAQLRLDTNRTLVTISRNYPMGPVEWTDRLLNVDPDSVRKEPNRMDEQMAELVEWEARVEVGAFQDVVEHTKSALDHIIIREDDGRLVTHAVQSEATGPIDASDDESKLPTSTPAESAADFGPVAEATEDGGKEGAESILSIEYLADQLGALRSAGIYDMHVRWGEQVPLMLRFDHENDDGEQIIEGEFYLAPRIPSDG